MPDLSDSVNWSEIDANNNNAAPNGWPEGMMPSGVNDAARADRGAMKRFWNKANPVQVISIAGGVYTFVTANPAYPTAYVDGEIYSFHSAVHSLGGESFQVNALTPKPIWKRLKGSASVGGSWAPIIAEDIQGNTSAQVVYNATLNGGAGVFLLLNPFIPISGDGVGGVSVPGGLTVTGDLTTAGSVAASGGMSINGDLVVIGVVSATGYKSRSGSGGPYQTNLFNIQWTGADGAHLWIDSTDQGPIVCAPGGNIVIGGSITAPTLSVSGAVTAGSVSASGSVSGGSLSGASISGGALNVTGSGTFGNGLVVNGGLGGSVAIRATAGAVQSDISGTAFYAPNGNVVCQAINAAATGNAIYTPNGNLATNAITATTVSCSGNCFPANNNSYYCGFGGNGWASVGAYAFPNLSDPSLKQDIEPVPVGCLDLVCAIEPKTYKWAEPHEADAGKTHWGFMAPEVRDVMERAGRRFDAVREENGVKMLCYDEMIAVLWQAVRELTDRLERK